MSIKCELVEELRRLKKSSLEAVDSENEFSDFKKYMHVHRKVEDDLINTIERAKSLPGKCLVLVCGNVGDGKSHLISYLNNHENKYLQGFDIHNDATESFDRYKDEKQTLAEVLEEFSDDKLCEYGTCKKIVAINLGVLSNFLDSEQGKRFTKLAKYVEDNKILTSTDIGDTSDENNIFFHVNFGDYHIYRLNEGKIDSPYISELINKIFGESPDNPFYSVFNYRCGLCPLADKCPVKYNYQMLGNSSVKNGIISVITETIVKDKIILSTRDLLNFFYDICVYPDFSTKSIEKSKDFLSDFMNYTIPNMLYGHEDVSMLLHHISNYDFLNHRSEDFDNLTTRFNTADSVSQMFEEYLEDSACKDFMLKNKDSFDGISSKREAVFKYLCRLIRISGKSSLNVIDGDFEEFIGYVYAAAQNDIQALKPLYRVVERCIYAWNGSTENSHIKSATSNIDYEISTLLTVKPFLDAASRRSETVFDKFTPNVTVSFSQSESVQVVSISIDYDLFRMLNRVANGYRPSAQDNNHYANFVLFINKLSRCKKNDDIGITILHHSHDELKKYQLTRDPFGFNFEEV